MNHKKYWQSFGELKETKGYKEQSENEFTEELPFESADKGFLNKETPRRDFLKYLGFSTTAAVLAASCEVPVRKSIPFAVKPEDIVPGISYYYATTYCQDGEVLSVLAKVRDGRPVKIEGNSLSPITKGGTSARAQASVLDLYNTARLRFPTINGKEVTLDAIDRSIASDMSSLGGAPVVLLTTTITSPTTLQLIGEFLAKYPGSRHVMYDAYSASGMLLANEASYGKRAIPSYRFDKAKVIVSLDADFLGTWISPVEFTKQYSAGKKINEKSPVMSKHIQFESIMSLTGANADERFVHKPSEAGAVAAGLLNALNGSGVGSISDAKLKAGIEKTAKLLAANAGSALVVSGSNDVNVQLVVNAINEAIKANGSTIDWSKTINHKKAVDSDFAQLLSDMNAGRVGALLVHNANPVYSWFDGDAVAKAIKNVKVSISFNAYADETASLCKYAVPDNHYLESWGDAESKTGLYSFIQPTINPLFKTRQLQDSLLKWSGAATDYLSYLKAYWLPKLGGATGWEKTIEDGVTSAIATTVSVDASSGSDSTASINSAVASDSSASSKPAVTTISLSSAPASAFNNAGVAAAIGALGNTKSGSGIEVVLYQKISVGANSGASNPWLQEVPDPVTKATWDNYVVISPKMAKELLDIDLEDNGQTDAYEVHPEKQVLKVTVNGKSVSLPFMIIPGVHPNTIGIALGYGRSSKIGKAAENVGQRAAQFSSLNGQSINFFAPSAQIEKTADEYPIAVTQTHSSYDTFQGKRVEVMKELTLAEFIAHPDETLEERDEELKPYGGVEKFAKEGTIYPDFIKPGIHWGMSIDLNSCTGCSACIVACHLENNVPIVGKSEVMRFHDMHWLRIDRYFSGPMDNPTVVFQPLMCQHCDNAPCENVCPVAAISHSSEGVNQMIYNRCIGTKYCANNCPYKVRRFNWADYMGADAFPDNQNFSGVGKLDDVVLDMNEDLTRMVLNPDVTVRSRGVMEKCSFCIQRCQEGKLKAKKESRPLVDADVQTACQQACPADAIVFGNINNHKSAITINRVDNRKRTFYSLEQLHTLPNVNYLVKVRNQDEMHHEAEKEG